MVKEGLTIHQGPGAQHKKNQQGKHSEGRAKVCGDNCWSRDSKNNNQNRVNFSKAMICTMQQITVKAKELKQQQHMLGWLLIYTGILTDLQVEAPESSQSTTEDELTLSHLYLHPPPPVQI